MARTGAIRRTDEAGHADERASTQFSLQALVAEARAQQQHGIADRIADAIESRTKKRAVAGRSRPVDVPPDLGEMLVELRAERRLGDLVLSPDTLSEVKDFIGEYSEMALLRSHGLEPRHKVLLVGPPGTGKTSLAEVFAHELRLPFYVVRYDGLIGSFLGETATRLRKLTDFVGSQRCVVFFDEFDTVGKERGDVQETGEIKRVVSSLLLQMDAIPSNCMIVCATNHPELLDRAVWRRFDLRLDVLLPGPKEISEWFTRLQADFGPSVASIEEEFVSTLNGLNFSDIQAFTLNVRRKVILSRGKLAAGRALTEGLAKLRQRRSMPGEADHGEPAADKAPPKKRRPKADKGPSEAPLPKGSLI